MYPKGNSREFMQQIADRSVSRRRPVRYGEDMKTLMIGSLSLSLGCVVLAAMGFSMLGKPMGEWNVRQFYGEHIMSSVAATVAIVGMALGYLGFRIGWKDGRRISGLSVAGILSCYLAVSFSLILVIYHEGQQIYHEGQQ